MDCVFGVDYDQLKGCIKRAIKLNLPYEKDLLDESEIDAAPLNCESCGVLFDLAPSNIGKGKTRNPRARSVDQIIPRGGYTRANRGYLCHRCNAIKNDATADELRMIARYIDRKLARPQ